MKLRLLLHIWAFLLIFSAVACRNMPASNEATTNNSESLADNEVKQPTTVYLVRHAEKDLSDPGDQDPALTPLGQERAEALRAELEGTKIDALYATKYKRTQNTLLPMSNARNLPIQIYEANDFTGLKSKIQEQHTGNTIVIAGHSNTLLPIVEALGAKRPVPEISDRQYDYLFKVIVAPDGSATVETEHFGASSYQ